MLGEDDTAAPKWFGTTMKYRCGFRARFFPVIQAAVSDGVAVNQVGHTTTLSRASFSCPKVVYPNVARGRTEPFCKAKSPSS